MTILKAELNEKYKIITNLVKNQKYSAIDVAKKFGLSRQRIGQILHKFGLSTKRMRKVKFGNPRDKFCSVCGGKKSEYAYVCQQCYRKKIASLPKRKFTCTTCGKPKTSKTAKQCWQCYLKSTPRKKVKCHNCGKIFTLLISKIRPKRKKGKPRHFCSRNCYLTWWKNPHKQ